jgi:glycosyltransferase involved in cell wall biosynthesis
MKILTLTNCPLNPGSGSGKTVLKFTEGLRNLGHEVDVLEPEDFEPLSFLKRAKSWRQAWGAREVARRKIGQKFYDLVEFYGGEFWWAASFLEKKQGRPFLVAHTNGLEFLVPEEGPVSWPRRCYQKQQKKVWQDTDFFVSLCRADRNAVIEKGFYDAERTAVVEPGLDEAYLSLPFETQRGHRVAFTGTWIERKGIRALAAVMSRLLSEHPVLELDLYGTSVPAEKVLNDFPADLRDKIHAHPVLPVWEMIRSLCATKVFFFPSRYEGFGMALAEAMACGCAAVTTPTGFGAGLKNNEEAIVCDFEDTDAMTQALNRLLTQDVARESMGRAGQKRVQGLNWKHAAAQLASLYERWTVSEGFFG